MTASLDVAKASMKSPSASCMSPMLKTNGQHVDVFHSQRIQSAAAGNLCQQFKAKQPTWHS